MERNITNWVPWRLFDGSIALSISMVLAALLKIWEDAVHWPVLGLLHQMTQWEDGVIIVATILLFPTALTLYGGFAMIFAAKQTVDNWAYQRSQRKLEEGRVLGVEEGVVKGRKQEQERVAKVLQSLAERGMPLTPEQAKALAGESDNA